MKKKIILIAFTLMLAFTTVVGCEKKEDTSKKTTETKKETKKTEEVELKTIGEEQDATFEVKLTNTTGQDITAISIKNSNDTAYPANMLVNSDKFAKDETRIVYYKSTAEKESATASGKVLPIEYAVQVTLADGTVCELHAFPFGDIEEGKINLQDKLAYISYKSVSAKQEVTTLDAEKAVKAQAEAAAQAEKDAAAAAQAAAQAAAEQAAQNQAAAQAQADAAASQYQAEEQAPAAQPQPDTTTDNTTTDQGDGCLDDGLTY